MLEQDRTNIDHNWKLMHWVSDREDWLRRLPNHRYGRLLDGRELTQWMIDDFFHLLDTDSTVDEALAAFNLARRDAILLSETWNTPQ